MGTLRTWWQKLTGSDAAPGPAARKPVTQAEPKVKEGLHLMDDLPGKRPSRVGAAGFDPYASDAGYSKPNNWDGVDPR